MQLELGDIIKLFSLQLDEFHEQIFVIIFISKERLVIQNIISNKIHDLPIKENKLLNKLIENIHLLKRHEKQGFVQQNNLSINTWIDIQGKYKTDIPFTLTGKITNIDHDMIEVTIYSLEEETIIYIDFAYQGISPDSNINTINIRDKPLEDLKKDTSEISESLIKDIENETINIDKIVFHEDLETIRVKEIKQLHKHAYSLDNQLNDMVEDILANNSNPSKQLLNEISILTERYTDLYNEFIYKKESKKDMDKNWSVDVISNKPLLFIGDDSYNDEYIRNTDFNKHINELESDLNEQYTTNSYAERYQKMLEIINKFYEVNDYELDENTKSFDYIKRCIETNLQENPNSIDSYSVCTKSKDNTRNPINKALSTSSFKNIIVLPNDKIHRKSVVYLPEALILDEIIKLKSENILEKSLVNNIGFTNYNINHSKIYEVIYVNEQSDNKIFDKIFTRYLHYKYDESKMTYEDFRKKILPSNDEIIMKIIEKLDAKNLSLYSVIKKMNRFSLNKDDINIGTYEKVKELLDRKMLELKQELLSKKRESSILSKESQINKSRFSEIYKDDIENYMDVTNLSTSEILSKMMDMDNIDLFTSLILLKKNDFLDFTKFDKKISDYINANEGRISSNKCSKYYLAKQYSSINQLEEDNNKIIYFDKEFDKTNYNLFDENTLENREECIKILTTKYKIEEEDAIYEYISMKNKQREVRKGDYALLYTEGKFMMFIRNKENEWEVTNKFSGMSGKEIFCNIQSDCFSIPSNSCSNLKDKQISNTLKDAKDAINDFDTDIVKKKAAFKEIMIKINDQNIQKLRLNNKHRENNAYKQSRMLYNIGVTYIPSDIEESPYNNIFQSILNIKDLKLRYEYVIKFCANYTRDANVQIENESQYWKYCVKTNMKLVPYFIYKLAISYHITKTYTQEIENICKDQGVLSDDNDKFIDKHSGYIIKEIDFTDTYQPDYTPLRVAVSPEIDKYDNIKDISKEYKHYIVKIIEAMSLYMVIKLRDSQKEYIMRNVVEDFNKYFESKPIKEEEKKLNAHSHYIMYYTLSYLAIEILCAVPNIQSNDTFPGCVKSFTGWPVTDKSDTSGLLYIACVALKLAKKDYPWKILHRKIKDIRPTPDSICSTIQTFLDKIITKVSVLRKINNKIIYNKKQRDIIVKPVVKNAKIFLPPQEKYEINFTLRKGLIGLSRNDLQIKSFYYTISLFKKIQDLVKSIIEDSRPLINEPLQYSINEKKTFMTNTEIQEHLKELTQINKLLKNKQYTKIYSKFNNYELHFPKVLNEFLKNKELMNLYLQNNLNDNEELIREMYPNLPEIIPRDKILFSDMLKSNSISLSNKDFEKIYKNNYEDILFDSSIFYKKQLDVKFEFDEIIENDNDNEFIKNLFEMINNDDIEIFKTNAIEEMKINVENISEYIFNYGEQKNSDKKKLKKTMESLVDSTLEIFNFWEPIRKIEDEVNIWRTTSESINDIENETIKNATKNIINTINYLTNTFPQLIKNRLLNTGNRFYNVSCPDHWDISDIHKNDIIKIIRNFYNFIDKYSKCPSEIIEILDNYSIKVKYYSKLCNLVKRHFEMNESSETLYISILYILFETIKSLMELTEDIEHVKITKCVANMIYDIFSINYFSDTFKQFNISNDEVYSTINRIKESEKNTILKKLEEMNDEQRNIDNEYKKYSIGDWSSGKFRTYDKKEYDEGQTSNIYRDNDFMSGLLGEIYTNDLDIEEAFDMSELPDDDIDPNFDE